MRVYIAGPYTGAQSVQCVVGNFHCFGLVFEGCHTQYRTEYFLLENAHLVMALKHGGLDVVAIGVGIIFICFTANQDFLSFLLADIQLVQDFLILVVRCLCTHHGA